MVLGTRVRQLLEAYEDIARFYSPDVCLGEAREYLPDLAKRQAVDSSVALTVLPGVSRIAVSVDRSLYDGESNSDFGSKSRGSHWERFKNDEISTRG